MLRKEVITISGLSKGCPTGKGGKNPTLKKGGIFFIFFSKKG